MKKILYVFAVIILSAIILIVSFSSISYSVFEKDIKDSISNKEYSRVEQYANCVVKTDEIYYANDLDDGMHVEVLPVLTATTLYSQNEDGSIGDGVTVYANAIQFIMFNLPESFTTSSETANGGLTIKLSNGSEKFYAFNNEISTNAADPNYGVNFYNSLNAFKFLYVYVTDTSISEDETELLSLSITSFSIKDEGTYDTGSITLSNKPSFNNSIYQEFNASVKDYNQAVIDDNSELKESSTNAINNKVTELSSNSNYLFQLSQYTSLNSSDFWVPMILIAVGILVVSVGIGYFVFRKPRRHYQKQYVQTAPQQQFSRNDIMGAAEYLDATQNKVPEEAQEEQKEEPNENE